VNSSRFGLQEIVVSRLGASEVFDFAERTPYVFSDRGACSSHHSVSAITLVSLPDFVRKANCCAANAATLRCVSGIGTTLEHSFSLDGNSARMVETNDGNSGTSSDVS
jgi:hypothetical protein